MDINVFFNSSAADFLDLADGFDINTILIKDIAIGIAHCHDFATQFGCLDCSIDRHVAGTGNDNGLSFEGSAVCLQDFVGKVADTESGCFRTDQRTAGTDFLAGDDAGEFILQSLVLSEQITDFTSADTDIASRNVCISTDMSV